MQFVVINGRNAKKIIVANCYRPPNGIIDIGLNVLKAKLGAIVNIDQFELVIMGDLNVDCIDRQSDSYKVINSRSTDFSLKPLTYKHQPELRRVGP